MGPVGQDRTWAAPTSKSRPDTVGCVANAIRTLFQANGIRKRSFSGGRN
jgi:hypothetical protein